MLKAIEYFGAQKDVFTYTLPAPKNSLTPDCHLFISLIKIILAKSVQYHHTVPPSTILPFNNSLKRNLTFSLETNTAQNEADVLGTEK